MTLSGLVRAAALLALVVATIASADAGLQGTAMALDADAARRLLADHGMHLEHLVANTHTRSLLRTRPPPTPFDCAARATYTPAVNQACLNEVCRAGEVTVDSARFSVDGSGGAALGTAPCCKGTGSCAICEAGASLTGQLELDITTRPERYSLGVWIANAGQPSCDKRSNAACGSNRCTTYAFPPTPPLVQLDAADSQQSCCGDIQEQGSYTLRVPGITIGCELLAGSGGTGSCRNQGSSRIDYCFGWSQNQGQAECFVVNSTPLNAAAYSSWATLPGTTSKCDCGIGSATNLEVFIPTCSRPSFMPNAAFTCATGSQLNPAAADIVLRGTSVADFQANCCGTFVPTCNKPSATATAPWACDASLGLSYNAAAGSSGPPSNERCCSFSPVCGRLARDTPGTFACDAELGLSYDAASAAVAPPTPDACCSFTPTCSRQVRGQPPVAPGTPPWVCDGLDPFPGADDVRFTAGDEASYLAACCIALGPTLPEVELAATGNITLPGVGLFTPITFTTTSTGLQEAPDVVLALTVPPGLVLPTTFTAGPSEATWSCSPPGASCVFQPTTAGSFSSGGTITCSLGAMQPAAAVACTFQVAPSEQLPTLFVVQGSVTIFEAGTSDPILDNADNNVAAVSVAARVCPAYMQLVGDSCEVLECEPCPDANPTVYFTTGRGASPRNSLWRIDAFQPGVANQPAHFLCQLAGIAGQMPGDISVLYNGDIIIIDTSGNVYRLPAASIPATGVSAGTSRTPSCPGLVFLTRLTGVGSMFTGLTSGLFSDELFLSGGSGTVRTLRLSDVAGTPPVQAAAGAQGRLSVMSLSCSNRGNRQNSGGTDVTLGPAVSGGSRSLFRFCSQDSSPSTSGPAGQSYTGTQFALNATGFSGAAAFVNEGLATATGAAIGSTVFANAGAFCTSTAVIGTGTRSAEGNLAGFFGIAISPAVTQQSPANPPPVALARSLQLGSAVPAIAVPGLNRLRVNGAANKPSCRLPARR